MNYDALTLHGLTMVAISNGVTPREGTTKEELALALAFLEATRFRGLSQKGRYKGERHSIASDGHPRSYHVVVTKVRASRPTGRNDYCDSDSAQMGLDRLHVCAKHGKCVWSEFHSTGHRIDVRSSYPVILAKMAREGRLS